MTKIRPVLLWLLITSPFFCVGQTANRHKPVSSALQPGPTAGYSGRQATFTFHRLTGQVEPVKKPMYELSIKGRPVSLPCPTPPQPRRRPC